MAQPYSDLVNQFQNLKPKDAQLGRRLNELLSINELLTTLNTARTLEETLDVLLLTLLGEYGCFKGVVFIKSDKAWRIGIGKGMRDLEIDLTLLPSSESLVDAPKVIRTTDGVAGLKGLFRLFHLILPVRDEERLVGLIGLGKSLLGEAGEKETLLATIADFGGVLISNSLYRHDLEQANRMLQRKIFQLNTLYEITESFSRCYEHEGVFQILSNNLMGQFFISRCAVVAFNEFCEIVFKKGLKPESDQLGTLAEVLPLKQWHVSVMERERVPCKYIGAFMAAHQLQYAVPIVGEEHAFGLLLLGGRLDRKKLVNADKDFMLSLAQQSAVALENVRLQKELIEKKRMERELQLAREIQLRLLPKGAPRLPGYEIAVEMRPYYLVGGDFYDFIYLEDGKLAFCLADVSGKSLPASMIMSTAQATLRALNSFAGLSPRDIIEKLNSHLCQSTQSNKFVTMFYAILDPITHQLTYINAGHNRPVLVAGDGSTTLLDKGGMVIGLFPMATYKVGTVSLSEGSKILAYTDGISEVVDQSGEEYGDERLVTTFAQLTGSAESQKEAVIWDVMQFSSHTMVDDMTLMVIKRRDKR